MWDCFVGKNLFSSLHNDDRKMKNGCITFCSRSFALESVSRRETAVQGQTTATSYRYKQIKTKKHQMKDEPTNEELKNRNRELENELFLYKTIIENVPISVFAKDVQDEYRYIIWNKELETVFGTKSEQIIGIHDYQLFEKKEEADYFRNYDISVMNGKKIVDIPNEDLRTADGVKIVHTRKIPIYDENNQPKILLGCLEDVTQKIQTEQALKNSERKLIELNADKDRFISILAHDLRNPFNTLLGFSDLLLKNIRHYDIEKIEKQLTLINKTAHNTYNLLDDLLLWIKSQSGKLPYEPQKIVFQEICNQIIISLKPNASSKNIEIKLFEREKIILTADINMFKTVLRNLITNAIKFTNENGQIQIYTEKNHTKAIITVSDNGIGIDKENQIKLWKLSQQYTTSGTAEEKGTGLGLILCKEFVERHGGKIWVESELGKGSDFKFTMPFCND